ncbi:MAG: dihydroneopterin aldolase [Verrucomicrobiota bacterium]|nr:dihydroneopterin aldolase [Verrucomicrobiota bacterium]
MNSDLITLRDIAVLYHVGVPDEERSKPQKLLISIEMEHDFSSAAASDDIAKTIDYFAVCQRVRKFGQDRNWKLIETLASELATMVLKEFSPRATTVEIKKFILPETRYVSVKVRRQQST